MRTMRYSIGVMRDAAELDSLPAHELARRVVQHLVGIDVAVIVRSGNRFGVKVVGPWTERAHDEAVTLKCLVYRRRLVDTADDRLEIHDVECPRVEVSVPADHVERMMVEHQLIDAIVLFYKQREVSLLVMRLELKWTTNVSLGVGRPFDELPEFVAVTFRVAHVAAALHDEQLGLRSLEINAVPVQNATMNDEIVAFSELQIAENALQHALSLADVDQLVSLGIAVEMLVVLVRLDIEHGDVLIEQDRHPVKRWTSALLDARRQEVPVMERLVIVRLELRFLDAFHGLDGSRRIDVIEQRRRSRESLVPHQLFRIQTTVRLAEGDVPFSRDCSQRVVVWHRTSLMGDQLRYGLRTAIHCSKISS